MGDIESVLKSILMPVSVRHYSLYVRGGLTDGRGQ